MSSTPKSKRSKVAKKPAAKAKYPKLTDNQIIDLRGTAANRQVVYQSLNVDADGKSKGRRDRLIIHEPTYSEAQQRSSYQEALDAVRLQNKLLSDRKALVY